MSSIDRDTATGIVNALRAGTVPPEGLEHIAVGIDVQMKALQEQREFVKKGRGAYKFIRGSYGSGKTFLTTLAASEALDHKFAASKVVISTADTPLYKLTEVYRRLCQNLTIPGKKGGALQSILDRWLYSLEQQVIDVDGVTEDSPGFKESLSRKVEHHLIPLGSQAGRMASCIKAYHEAQFAQDYARTRGILDWLSGETKIGGSIKRAAGVSGTLDNSDVLLFLKGLLIILSSAGYRGLLLVLDECETVVRLRRQERYRSLEILRQVIDAIDRNEFPGLHVLATGTPDFFESPQGVPQLEPLHDRIGVKFNDGQPDNLRQPQIRLLPADRERLGIIARKVREIYPAASHETIMQKVSDDFIMCLIDRVTRGFGGHVDVVPRLFLRELINVLDLSDQYADYDPAARYSFDRSAVEKSLSLMPEEELMQEDAAREVSF